MAPRPSRILLADCDQMFVAVARLIDPEGAGRAKLLVVGGRANSRGVVCSASYEARAFGVHAGMPAARAARLCPGAMFVPVPGRACGEAHRKIRKVLEQWAPVVQAASVDEFYLDLSGTERLYRGESLTETAQRLRSLVHVETGFTLSIGGGTNRLIAKMAAEQAKPKPGSAGTGVLVVPPGEEPAFMAERMLAEIPGVGPRFQSILRKRSLVSVRDALRLEPSILRQWFGDGTGRWLYRRIRGQGSDAVSDSPENRSMSREQTFFEDLTTDEAIQRRLLRLLTGLAASLRSEGLAAHCVTVKLRDHDFRTRQASRTVRGPISTDRALFRVARDLLAGLRSRRRVASRLVGIKFSSLTSIRGPHQLSFFPPEAEETPRDRRLAGAVDAITKKMGDTAIGPARLTRSKPRT